MNKIYVIFTKGLQCSGKSTWSTQFVKEHQDYKRINRDSFRHMLSGYTFDDNNEKVVTKLCDDAIMQLIDYKFNIVIDQMNLNSKQLEIDKRWIKEYCENKHNLQVEFIIKEFPVTLGEALIRDKQRSFPIGEKVIKNTYRKYEVELKQMLERAKPKQEWNGDLPYVILCDIDGTLAHSPNRRIFDFKEVINDNIHFPIWSILDKYKGKVDVILLSGREEICRKETEEWLKLQAVNYQALYMRKEKDFRPDTVIKRELFDAHIKDKYNVMFVLDDRKSVCNQWVEMGLFLLDVSQDPFCKNPF